MTNQAVSSFGKCELFGIDIDAITMAEAVQLVDERIKDDEFTRIAMLNALKLSLMSDDPLLRRDLISADVKLADGASIVFASRLLGKRLPERVAGIDLMYKLLQLAHERSYRVYFLGAKQEVLESVISRVRHQYPNLIVSGFKNGYFQREEEPLVALEIAKSDPHILFVAISSPLKEQFMARWERELSATIIHGVGGSFDVYAGRTKRAPTWMQLCGLEWMYRVLQEPRRMWRRYLVTNFQFLRLLIATLISAKIPWR